MISFSSLNGFCPYLKQQLGSWEVGLPENTGLPESAMVQASPCLHLLKLLLVVGDVIFKWTDQKHVGLFRS